MRSIFFQKISNENITTTFSPNGKLIVSRDFDKDIKLKSVVWSERTGFRTEFEVCLKLIKL